MRPTPGHVRSWPPESFLGRLHAHERDVLLGLGRNIAFKATEHLLVDGDRGGFVILIHAGQVKVVMQEEQGTEHLLGIRSRGDLLGELSYIDKRPRSASVVAISKGWASSIAWDKLDSFMREHPRVALEIARVLANRLRASDESSREIRSNSVAVRVAKLLLSLAAAFDDPNEGAGGHTVIALSQADIAQLAHAAEVTVNRVLSEFRRQDVVRTAYRKLVVPCLVCLDLMAVAVANDPKEGAKSVLGCGGANPHRPQ